MQKEKEMTRPSALFVVIIFILGTVNIGNAHLIEEGAFQPEDFPKWGAWEDEAIRTLPPEMHPAFTSTQLPHCNYTAPAYAINSSGLFNFTAHYHVSGLLDNSSNIAPFLSLFAGCEFYRDSTDSPPVQDNVFVYTAVPTTEPVTMVLFGIGLVGFSAFGKKPSAENPKHFEKDGTAIFYSINLRRCSIQSGELLKDHGSCCKKGGNRW